MNTYVFYTLSFLKPFYFVLGCSEQNHISMKDTFPVPREDKVEVKDSLFSFSITGSSKSK